jgi:hypothetical protein
MVPQDYANSYARRQAAWHRVRKQQPLPLARSFVAAGAANKAACNHNSGECEKRKGDPKKRRPRIAHLLRLQSHSQQLEQPRRGEQHDKDSSKEPARRRGRGSARAMRRASDPVASGWTRELVLRHGSLVVLRETYQL